MDDFTPQQDSLLAPIQFNHWYKCVVEINFVTNMVTYYLDDAVVKSMSFPALATMYGIDRLLVFRGRMAPMVPSRTMRTISFSIKK